MRNISQDKAVLTLTKPELSSLPNRRLLKKYESLFKNDKEPAEINFESKQDFEMAKFAHFPEVRRKSFLAMSNSNRTNTEIVIELARLR